MDEQFADRIRISGRWKFLDVLYNNVGVRWEICWDFARIHMSEYKFFDTFYPQDRRECQHNLSGEESNRQGHYTIEITNIKISLWICPKSQMPRAHFYIIILNHIVMLNVLICTFICLICLRYTFVFDWVLGLRYMLHYRRGTLGSLFNMGSFHQGAVQNLEEPGNSTHKPILTTILSW